MQFVVGLLAHWQALLVVSTLDSVFSRDVAPGETYTVELEREIQPLHSEDGVIQYKSAYWGTVSIGGPVAQPMTVVFDTGSGHLVVPSAVCRSPACKLKRRFKRKGSVTAQDINLKGEPHPFVAGEPRDSLTIAYGTGEVVGILMKDYVCLGAQEEPTGIFTNSLLQRPSLVVDKVAAPSEDGEGEAPQPVVQVETEISTRMEALERVQRRVGRDGCMDLNFIYVVEMSDDPFSSYKFDGVLGLGLPSLSETPEFNFMEVSVKHKAWTGMLGFEWTFSVFLGWAEEEVSAITFGGWDRAHVPEGAEFLWFDVENSELGYWQVKIDEVWANDTKLDLCNDGTCRAIVDTGTSLLAVPVAMGLALQDPLRHRADETMCNGQGPQLKFVLGGMTLTMDPIDIARPEVVTDPTHQEAVHANPTTSDDTPLQQPSNITDPASSTEEDDSKAPGSLNLPTDGSPQMCVAMLMYIDLQAPLHEKTIVFGEPILQRYYTAFDANPQRPRVGFVESVHTAPRKITNFL